MDKFSRYHTCNSETNQYYSSTCHGRTLGWTATCFGRPLLRCTNYFAMLKYLHPTATCLTRPADSRMLDYIPAKEANRHGSFQICGDYYDISWSKVQHLCVFTCTHYTVNKCCWFFHTFQHCSFHLSLYTALLTDVLYNVNAFDIMAHMSIPCHEGPPATKGHFSSEPAVAGRGRYSRTPLIRPPSESHWCGRIRGMVAREGFVYKQNAQSVTRNVVVWEGWSLVRVVVRQGFYCTTVMHNHIVSTCDWPLWLQRVGWWRDCSQAVFGSASPVGHPRTLCA